MSITIYSLIVSNDYRWKTKRRTDRLIEQNRRIMTGGFDNYNSSFVQFLSGLRLKIVGIK